MWALPMGFAHGQSIFSLIIIIIIIIIMIIIIIHLLSRAPTGDFDCTLRTAQRPRQFGADSKSAWKMQGNTASVGRLNSLNCRTVRKAAHRKKITTQV
jgi:hypothetical protein